MTPIHNAFRRIAWSGALVLLLSLLAFKAGKEGLSNFYSQSAHMEIERWSKPGQLMRGDEGARVTQYLAKSLEYSPGNPWPVEEMGTLQLRGIGALRDPQLANAAARSAKIYFETALLARPTSPFAWANFTLAKLYLGEYDDALLHALARAEQLGPWEAGVQQTVIFVGLTLWGQLSPAQRSAVTLAMQRGAQRDPAKIAEIARAFARIDLFCALSYSRPQHREICTQIGNSGSRPTPQK